MTVKDKTNKKLIDPDQLNQRDFWIYDAGYRAGFLEKDKEIVELKQLWNSENELWEKDISDLKKENEKLQREINVRILQSSKNFKRLIDCEQKLANNTNETLDKAIAEIDKHRWKTHLPSHEKYDTELSHNKCIIDIKSALNEIKRIRGE